MNEKHVEFYKKLVLTLKEMSPDERLKVGAVLLKDGRVVATGYNGQLPGQPHEQIIQDDHDISTLHAEMNILCFCAKQGISAKDTILVTSHFPCQICTKLLIQSGIKLIYYIDDYKNDENPFKQLISIYQLK